MSFPIIIGIGLVFLLGGLGLLFRNASIDKESMLPIVIIVMGVLYVSLGAFAYQMETERPAKTEDEQSQTHRGTGEIITSWETSGIVPETAVPKMTAEVVVSASDITTEPEGETENLPASPVPVPTVTPTPTPTPSPDQTYDLRTDAILSAVPH